MASFRSSLSLQPPILQCSAVSNSHQGDLAPFVLRGVTAPCGSLSLRTAGQPLPRDFHSFDVQLGMYCRFGSKQIATEQLHDALSVVAVVGSRAMSQHRSLEAQVSRSDQGGQLHAGAAKVYD